MFKNYFTLISLVICSAISFSTQAQTKRINITTTAVPFLRINPDARSGGMGEIGIATSPDGNSSLWSTAKIPFAQNKTAIGLTYVPWLRPIADLYLISLAGYHQLDETQAISGSLKYFSLGNIQFTDENGNDLNSFNPREYAFDAGYSRKLSDKLGLGIAIRYIHSNLAKGTYNGESYKSGSAVAGDISLFHDGTSGMSNSGLNWGVALSNLGSKISYTNDANRKEFLPANLGVGVVYNKVFNENTSASFGLDINKLLVPSLPDLSGSGTSADSAAIAEYRNKGSLSGVFNSFDNGSGHISAGIEVMFLKQIAFRAGYFHESRKHGNRKYFTMGAGLNFTKFGINFSYLIPSGSDATRSPLEDTFRTGLLFNFNNK